MRPNKSTIDAHRINHSTAACQFDHCDKQGPRTQSARSPLPGLPVKKTLLLAAVLTAASSAALAQSSSPRFYIGGGLGQSKIVQDYNFSDFVVPVPGAMTGFLSTDRKGTPLRAFFGFKISPYFGIEAGFQSFGKFGSRQTITSPALLAGSYDTSWTVSGAHVDGLLTLPIADVMSVSGKVGAIRATTNITSSTPFGGSTSTENRLALRYGAAFQVELSRSLAMRLDADVNKGATVGNALGFAGDVRLDYNVFTGSVLFKF